MIPATTARVAAHTAMHVNDRIQEETEASIAYFTRHPEEIDDRLDELDREWDVERTLEANAAVVSLVGLGLAAFVDRRFIVLPALVAGFLLQHALQGWCPPLPAIRSMGVRTASEIEEERSALRQARGDFAGAEGAH